MDSIKQTAKRQPSIFLVCGETGVGKTYRNKQEIRRYLQDSSTTGKKGRKALAFDTNDDDYPEFITVDIDHIKSLKNISARSIRPFNKDGSPMDDEEKKGIVKKIIKTYKDGLLVLDDIDHYMMGAKGQAMIGALCTVRHRNIDLLLTHQSISKISTSEFQNCSFLRLHHQVDDVTRYKERIPKYHLVRIAQLIVDQQYEQAVDHFTTGQLTEQEFKIQSSFFVYVDMRKQRISGCTKPTFIRACKTYIDQEENKKVKMLLLNRDFKDNPIYKNRNEVIIKLLKNYLRHYQAKMIDPLREIAKGNEKQL